ncbi:MAG TPA: geranylgeranyl reductase family protein [Acidimicrobiales bacterium]|nr:geranylgeranyl reductase family protein [Acidimicrobiales bacterium]
MKVVVVGAGPAGSAAAIWLARGGADVVVIDKATFPRDKCCGDGLTTGALRRLETLGLDPSTMPSWQRVDDIVIRSVSGRTQTFPLPRGRGTYAAVVRRTELDAALVALARANGATVREACGVTGISVAAGGTGVHVATETGEVISGDYLIGADGVWSATRKLSGTSDEDGYLGEWHAFRQYRKSGTPASRDLWVLFEQDLRPGYAWSFPLADDTVNVGIGILRRPGEPTKDLGRRFREVLERPQFAAVIGDSIEESPAKAWPIPARVEKSALSALDGRVLFVGDAARATDPMTGEGIGQALETAEYAATAILTSARPAQRYADVVARGLARDNRMAGWLSRNGLTHRKGIRAALRIAGLNGWTRRNFARWLFEDEPRAVLATPRRWHRRFLNRDGAFPPNPKL